VVLLRGIGRSAGCGRCSNKGHRKYADFIDNRNGIVRDIDLECVMATCLDGRKAKSVAERI